VTNELDFNVSALKITVESFVGDLTMNRVKSKVDTKSEGPHKYESNNA
jgi:hypothetical protein